MSTTTLAAPRWRPLTGGTVVWLFMAVELATFAMFFLWHAASWGAAPDAYAAAQASLDVSSGLRGTVILLAGSWLAYQAVLSNADGRSRATAGWLGGAALAGVLFTANKVAEYATHLGEGITLSTNGFWFSYLFLTFLHLVHVLGGVGILAYLAVRATRGAYGPDDALPVEAGAAYWHLVDVVWVFLFPLLYVMHP